jgi:hypothetical protein
VGQWGVEGEGTTPARCAGEEDRSGGDVEGTRRRNQQVAAHIGERGWRGKLGLRPRCATPLYLMPLAGSGQVGVPGRQGLNGPGS